MSPKSFEFIKVVCINYNINYRCDHYHDYERSHNLMNSDSFAMANFIIIVCALNCINVPKLYRSL